MIQMKKMVMSLVLLCGLGLIVSSANGAVYFQDDFEQYTDVSTTSYPDTTGDYDPDVTSLWVDSEWYAQDIQVTNYNLPGPGQGDNYLRIYQTGSSASTPVAKLSERVIYKDIRVDFLLYIPTTGAGRVILQDSGITTEFIRFNEVGVGSITVKNSAGAWANLNATFEEDVWTRIRVETDMYNGTYSLSVNGGPAEIAYSNVTYGHDKVQIYPTGKVFGGNWGMFIDDLSVVPEPMTMVLLGLGGILGLRRRS